MQSINVWGITPKTSVLFFLSGCDDQVSYWKKKKQVKFTHSQHRLQHLEGFSQIQSNSVSVQMIYEKPPNIEKKKKKNGQKLNYFPFSQLYSSLKYLYSINIEQTKMSFWLFLYAKSETDITVWFMIRKRQQNQSKFSWLTTFYNDLAISRFICLQPHHDNSVVSIVTRLFSF